jgi:hypothetical protein
MPRISALPCPPPKPGPAADAERRRLAVGVGAIRIDVGHELERGLDAEGDDLAELGVDRARGREAIAVAAREEARRDVERAAVEHARRLAGHADVRLRAPATIGEVGRLRSEGRPEAAAEDEPEDLLVDGPEVDAEPQIADARRARGRRRVLHVSDRGLALLEQRERQAEIEREPVERRDRARDAHQHRVIDDRRDRLALAARVDADLLQDALRVLERRARRELDALGERRVRALCADEHALRARELELIDPDALRGRGLSARRAGAEQREEGWDRREPPRSSTHPTHLTASGVGRETLASVPRVGSALFGPAQRVDGGLLRGFAARSGALESPRNADCSPTPRIDSRSALRAPVPVAGVHRREVP